VYLVRFRGANDAPAVAEAFREMSEYVVYAHPNWIFELQDECPPSALTITDCHFPETTSDVGQWNMDNRGYHGTEDMDINLPEGLAIQRFSTKKVGIIDDGLNKSSRFGITLGDA
jgi:hypothetical protein